MYNRLAHVAHVLVGVISAVLYLFWFIDSSLPLIAYIGLFLVALTGSYAFIKYEFGQYIWKRDPPGQEMRQYMYGLFITCGVILIIWL